MVATNTEVSPRRQRWEDITQTPLLIGSALFLFAYSILILVPELGTLWRVAVILTLSAVWAAFIVDLIVRVTLTARGHRFEFMRKHPAETASAVIPWVRPFQLLRHLSRIPWFSNASGGSIRGRVVVTALAYTALFVYVISLGVLAAERGAPGATILTFGESIWWAFVTVATVGYGDYAPVTVVGRILAVVLMAGGVAIIGTASATIVSYLNERIKHAHEQHDAELRAAEQHSADMRATDEANRPPYPPAEPGPEA